MQGGVLVSDNYPTGPSGWGVAIAQMYATTDTMWFIKNNRKMAEAPGTKAEYRSVDTQMLGMIIRKVTGEKVSDYFSKTVWQKVGAKYAGTWNVDRVGGQEKTFCCFNASAIDYAKVGLMLLNNGYVGSERVVSADWIKRLRTPVVKLDRDWGYGAQIWHPYPDIMMMMGLHGQYVYIDPATRTVIVKSSDVPTGKEDEAAVASVLNQISKLRS
jgi:CubicO group peptidase (beta-lactamase class C family)